MLARRPELDKALLTAGRAGDQLVITKLDRLGRSLEHLIALSKQLQTPTDHRRPQHRPPRTALALIPLRIWGKRTTSVS